METSTEVTAADLMVGKKVTVSGVDSLDRLIELRKPTCLQKFELPKILGNDAMNQAWYMQCMMLLHVSSIDGEPCFFAKDSELKALVNQLGDEGIEKVTELYMDNFMPKPFEEVKEELKK